MINNIILVKPLLPLQELELPPPDPLYGLRIHSWVLVLEGKREVPESFFIEPFTGIAHPITSPSYLGIETVWNHQNLWVNMQDCSEGVKVSHYFMAVFSTNMKVIFLVLEQLHILLN